MKHTMVFALLLIVSCSSTGVDAGLTPTAGERIAATVFTHCGFYEVDFAGASWTPSSIDRGSMPEGTDSMATEGTLELISQDEVLFRANSGLEVRFVPAPPDLDPIPPCD